MPITLGLGDGFPMKHCKCGCGETVRDDRVFANKEHQHAWMRAEAAREGYGRNSDTTPDHVITPSPGTSAWYAIGFCITSFIVFVGSWAYCIATYGFLLGVGLGWLPSIIVAIITGALWPLIALGLAFVALTIFRN